MQSITDLYSSAYLTATGMNGRPHPDNPFDEWGREPPIPRSLFARIRSRLLLAISRMRKPGLKPGHDLLSDRELRT